MQLTFGCVWSRMYSPETLFISCFGRSVRSITCSEKLFVLKWKQ